MRAGCLIPVLLVMLLSPIAARSDPTPLSPAAAADYPAAAADYNEARWAEWDAQARITDGDYDGAVQAEQRADTARKQAAEDMARASDPPAPATPDAVQPPHRTP